MKLRLWITLCIVVLAGAVGGCDTPATRVKTHATAYAKLSPSDKRLVLSGRVRNGMTAEAVRIAWGEPAAIHHAAGTTSCCLNSDAKDSCCKTGPCKMEGKDAGTEHWLYARQLTLKAPMDSFDRWLPGNGVFGPHLGDTTNAGFGFGGIGNEGGLLYQPHFFLTDSEIKKKKKKGRRDRRRRAAQLRRPPGRRYAVAVNISAWPGRLARGFRHLPEALPVASLLPGRPTHHPAAKIDPPRCAR